MGFEIRNAVLHAYHPSPGTTSVTVPEGVTEIGAGAFRDCEDLISITLPEGLDAIGEGAFLNCGSLTDITIPAGVRVIGEETFLGCGSLASVTLPEGLVTIGPWAFAWCSSLTDITLPEGLKRIGSNAFLCCYHLRSITLPESVEDLCIDAFRACRDLQEIRVAENNRHYADIDGALFDKGLETLLMAPSRSGEYRIPQQTTTIGEQAFRFCHNMTAITFPEGVTVIGEGAFQECESLTSLRLPMSLTRIRAKAFDSCTQLERLTLPAGVTDIGEDAFDQCYSLRRVTICKGNTAHLFYCGRQLQTEHIRMLLNFINAALPEQEAAIQQQYDPGLIRSMTLHLALWRDSASAKDYLREHSKVILRDLIDLDLTGLLERLLLSGCLSLNMVDWGILYANNNRKYEAQIMLTRHKHAQFSTDDPMGGLKL